MNNNPEGAILSSAYFPPIEYFRVIARVGNIFIEKHETYQKQTYRNRCKILAGDGPLSLSIPLIKGDDRTITSMEIDYSKPWLQQHKRGLVSAYNSSPFFEYYQDDIFKVLDARHKTLFDLNIALTELMLNLLGIRATILPTPEYIKEYPAEIIDFRESIHPKKESLHPLTLPKAGKGEYYQVFIEKFGFTPNLSALDLLFNEGPDSTSYLL